MKLTKEQMQVRDDFIKEVMPWIESLATAKALKDTGQQMPVEQRITEPYFIARFGEMKHRYGYMDGYIAAACDAARVSGAFLPGIEKFLGVLRAWTERMPYTDKDIVPAYLTFKKAGMK